MLGAVPGTEDLRLTSAVCARSGAFQWTFLLTVSVAACTVYRGAAADSIPAEAPEIYALEQLSYDNNLYRLPAYFGTDVIGPNLSRADHINTIAAGGFHELRFGSQLIEGEIRVADNRFVRNSDLNNTSGNAKLTWLWRLSPFLTGDAGGTFSRSLAGFANTRFQGRDLVDTGEYFASGHLKFAAHWQLNAGIRNSDTTHTLDTRRFDNFRSRSANAGFEYVTTELDSFGFDYRYTDATFPYLIGIGSIPFDRSYHDSAARFISRYALSGKTQLDFSAGYLRRIYPNDTFGSFSGTVWKAAVQWQATGKTQVDFAVWRDLTAYVDAESDYFVARGESVSPTWNATERISLSLDASWIDQKYIGASTSSLEFDSRHDRVRSQQANLKYTPRDWIALQLSYKLEQRDSNRAQFPYSDKLLWASLTATF